MFNRILLESFSVFNKLSSGRNINKVTLYGFIFYLLKYLILFTKTTNEMTRFSPHRIHRNAAKPYTVRIIYKEIAKNFERTTVKLKINKINALFTKVN